MKKIIALILVAAMAMSLCACGRGPANTVYSAQDLKGRTAGVLAGSAAEKIVNNAGAITSYATAAELGAALSAGTVDCVVADEATAEQVRSAARGLTVLEEPYLQGHWQIAAAKENRELTRDLNDAIEALNEDGVISKIFDGYVKGTEYRYESPERGEDAEETRGTVTLAADPELYPYSRRNKDGTWDGADVDIARAICDYLNVELEITAVDQTQLVNEVWHGRVTFAMGCMYASEETVEKIDYSDPYLQSPQMIVVRR